MTLDDALTTLLRARRLLDNEQGRIARRNARAAVKAAAAVVLRAMDREYPLIRKERVVKASMSPLAKKRRERAKRMDWMQIDSYQAVLLAQAGLKTQAHTTATGMIYYGPTWAAAALRGKVAIEEIRRANRSPAVRKRINALLRLRSDPKPVVP